MKKLFLILFFLDLSFSTNEKIYINKNIIEYLNKNGFVVGIDISPQELEDIVNGKTLENNKQNNYNILLQFESSFLSFLENKNLENKEIKEKLSKNKEHPINKAFLNYIDSNNQSVEDKQKDLEDKYGDRWWTKIVNFILDLIKF